MKVLRDRNDLAFLVLGIWNREIATVGGPGRPGRRHG